MDKAEFIYLGTCDNCRKGGMKVQSAGVGTNSPFIYADLLCPSCGANEKGMVNGADLVLREIENTEELKEVDTMETLKPIEKGHNSGNKYHRTIVNIHGKALADIDVYSVLGAFKVENPAIQHAVKKLLCAGIRGKGSALNDITECYPALDRAIRIEKGIEPAPEETNAEFVEKTLKSTTIVADKPPLNYEKGDVGLC